MTPNKPGTDAKTDKARAPQDKECTTSPTGATGGAHAEEEDIGTEGAGTEPRETVDPKREPGASPASARKDNKGS